MPATPATTYAGYNTVSSALPGGGSAGGGGGLPKALRRSSCPTANEHWLGVRVCSPSEDDEGRLQGRAAAGSMGAGGLLGGALGALGGGDPMYVVRGSKPAA